MKSPIARAVPQVVIRADESAHWMVAGLSQLERLLRALQESLGEAVEVTVVWAEKVPPNERLLPSPAGLSRLGVRTAETAPSAELVLSTRTVLYRRLGMAPISATELNAELQASRTGETWDYLENREQIGTCERRLLRGSGKSQDGLVSRYLNRPISRALSRVLLKFAVTPTGWTLTIVLLPLVGALLLAGGDYTSVVCGLLLYQLYSIFDGCDGEIARAKYLGSKAGARLDTWCDIAGNLLLVMSLGYGLARPEASWNWLAEGIAVALLILANELLLAALEHRKPVSAKASNDILYPRQQRLFPSQSRSGWVWWLVQLTKRDVSFLIFLGLALAGQPGWILHLLGLVAAGSVLLVLCRR